MDYGGVTVLDVPAVAVGPGEIFALIGPNGAGKSTLLRILGLLERPAAGIVRFRGQPVPWGGRDLLDTRRQFACVFQEPLLCDATVEANVALGLRLRHRPAEEVAAQTRTWLARLGIAHLAGREARTLSGGEAQRTSLARAFAHYDVLYPPPATKPFAEVLRESLFAEIKRDFNTELFTRPQLCDDLAIDNAALAAVIGHEPLNARHRRAMRHRGGPGRVAAVLQAPLRLRFQPHVQRHHGRGV
jgi:ABC-type sugar transport system ATPase subunit